MYRRFSIRLLSSAFIISTLVTGLVVSAQEFHVLAGADSKMKSLRAWGSLMKKEYPSIDFYHTAVDQLYPKMVHLFDDEYFVPVFGEPFDEVGGLKQRRITMAIRNCFSGKKKIEDEDRWLEMLESPFSAEMGAFGHDYVIVAIKETRKKKADYQAALKVLDSSNQQMTAADLIKYRSMMTSDFASLLPSDLAVMNTLVTTQAGYVANSTVKQLLQQEQGKSYSRQSAITARDFTIIYRSVLQLASDSVRLRADAEMRTRSQAILKALMQTEQTKLESLPAGEDGIKAQNAWYSSFNNSYNDFNQADQAVQAVLNKYNDIRKQALLIVRPSLETRIDSASSISELEEIEAFYLAGSRNGIADELKTKDRQRQAFLKEEAKKADEARRQEVLKTLEDQNAKLIAQNASNALKKDSTHYGSLLMNELKYGDAWLNIYTGNYAGFAALEKNVNTENVPVIMFKSMIDEYSDECHSYLPEEHESVDFYDERFLYSEMNYIFNRREDHYEKYISKTVYMRSEYAYAYQNVRSPADKKFSSDILGAFLTVLTGDGIYNLQSMPQYGTELKNDAWLLIRQNGCAHPGIRVIMNNLNEYAKGRRN